MTQEQKLMRFILGLEGQLAKEVNALIPTSLADALIGAKSTNQCTHSQWIQKGTTYLYPQNQQTRERE